MRWTSRGRGTHVGLSRAGLAALAALAAAGLSGCGSARHAATHPRRSTRPPATATGPGAARAAHPPAPAATPLTRLDAALSAALAKVRPGSGVEVYDVTAGRELFSWQPSVKRPPASVEKLYTTVALLDKLGADARLRTQLLGAGHLGPGGIWHGNLYLVGDGDPTLGDGTFNRIWEGGYGPTAQQLVAQLSARGIRRVTGQVIGDASLFDSRPGGPATGYAPDIPDFGGELAALSYDHGATLRSLSPGAFAARELVLTMRGAHIRARASRGTASAPVGAPVLAAVSSPPLSVLLRLMDVPSDDFFAEMLTKQLGVRFGDGGSISAGAAVISEVATALGVHPVIVDGSGLSRSDRSSPAEIVALLQALWGTQPGDQLKAALPLVGVNGTVQTIATHTAAQGHCLAKTGTLNDVTNLAGYCHAPGHHALAFALFIDGPNNAQALTLIGRMAAAIARY